MTIFPSAARTTAQTSEDFYNTERARGMRVTINVTALTAGASLTFTINARPGLSGATVALLASAAVTATGVTTLVIYPTITAVSNSIAQTALPDAWNMTTTVADTKSVTWSAEFSPLY